MKENVISFWCKNGDKKAHYTYNWSRTLISIYDHHGLPLIKPELKFCLSLRKLRNYLIKVNFFTSANLYKESTGNLFSDIEGLDGVSWELVKSFDCHLRITRFFNWQMRSETLLIAENYWKFNYNWETAKHLTDNSEIPASPIRPFTSTLDLPSYTNDSEALL